MRWRGLAVGAVLAAVLLGPHDGWAQGTAAPAPEPVSRGRPLGEWRRELRDGRPIIRERAVVALCEVGGPAVPLLIDAIQDYDFNVRTLAILCLGRLGPQAKEAVPALVTTLRDGDWIVRRYAAGALGLLELTAEAAAPALARTAIEDVSSEVRQTARFALARLGSAARETARPIAERLSQTGTDEAAKARAAELLRELEKR